MNNPLRSKRTEWVVTLPGFLWLALFFAIPALIVLAFTFHGHDASGGVGEWSLSTWRELVDPDYPAIVWNTIRISFEVTIWSIVLAVPSAYAIARMNSRWRAVVAGSIMLPFWTSFVVRVFAWKTMLHPDGWLQTCYHAYLHFKYWLFAWVQGGPAPVAAAGAGNDCLIGIARCTIDAAKTTILDSEVAVVLVSVYSFLPFAIMPIQRTSFPSSTPRPAPPPVGQLSWAPGAEPRLGQDCPDQAHLVSEATRARRSFS